MNWPLPVHECSFYHDRATPVSVLRLVRLDAPQPLPDAAPLCTRLGQAPEEVPRR